MFQFIYASSAADSLSAADLEVLLRKSREKHKRIGVTGMLLHRAGRFVQGLEGEQQVVQLLAAQIAADSRHRGFAVLCEGEVERRDFPDWPMGYRDLSAPEHPRVTAHPSILEEAFGGTVAQDRRKLVRAILMAFRTD